MQVTAEERTRLVDHLADAAAQAGIPRPQPPQCHVCRASLPSE